MKTALWMNTMIKSIDSKCIFHASGMFIVECYGRRGLTCWGSADYRKDQIYPERYIQTSKGQLPPFFVPFRIILAAITDVFIPQQQS
jgi:hypothetical protein